MISFQNDYSEGAHPSILKKIAATNLVQQIGYGDDEYSKQAKDLIRDKINVPEANVYFVSGGTQANLLVISSLLKPYEAVISASTGHIYTNEAGAIEAVGHRVISVETPDGKLTIQKIKKSLEDFNKRPHVVKPKLIYISNSTEIGSLYSGEELRVLYRFCQANQLLLFMDGARLGSALTAKANSLTLEEVAHYTDVFYIGGTKNGALLGEALVFPDPELCSEFDYIIKQKGGLLAKGRLLGIQFLELFTNDLFFELAKQANQMAERLALGLAEAGVQFWQKPESNQIFPIFSKEMIVQLQKEYQFHLWEEIDEKYTAVRLICSWATQRASVELFLRTIEKNKSLI